MNKIRTLIVDDEALARNVIRAYLDECEDVEIVGEAENGQEALEKIEQISPELVFLDIQMPVLNGFEVLDQLVEPPVIVFSTAYDEYAIRAFEVNAVDYLLKPYPKERFQRAMERARTVLAYEASARKDVSSRLDSLLRDIQRDTTYLERLLVRERGRIVIVNLSKVLWLEASGDYVTIRTEDGRSHLVTRTLSSFESKLDPRRFVRIHRSAIINLDQVDSIVSLDDGRYEVTLKGGERVTSSRSGGRLLRRLTL